jgi:hypothetical protein
MGYVRISTAYNHVAHKTGIGLGRDPEATPCKYLASIRIKGTAATITNPKAQYAIRTGAGVFVGASVRIWAARRGMRCRPAGLIHAKVWPRTGPYFLAATGSRQKILEIGK